MHWEGWRPGPGLEAVSYPPPRSFDFALSQRSSIVKLLKGSQCGPGPSVKASVGSFEEMFSFTLVSSPSDCVHFCCPGYALRIPPSLALQTPPHNSLTFHLNYLAFIRAGRAGGEVVYSTSGGSVAGSLCPGRRL